MKTLLLFGGTTEGRTLTSRLARPGLRLLVSVATQYGRELLEEQEGVTIFSGRMRGEDMIHRMEEHQVGLVVDATHPYASGAGKTIKETCRAQGLPLLRLSRPESQMDHCVMVPTAQEAARYLEETAGNILLTTGTKDLEAFTRIQDYQSRLYLRVLPAVESLEHCRGLGISPGHVMAMQGPFSRGLNRELMLQWHIRTLVTKDGGSNGGFAQKAQAAREVGATLVVIGRPRPQEGMTPEEIIKAVDRWMEEDR